MQMPTLTAMPSGVGSLMNPSSTPNRPRTIAAMARAVQPELPERVSNGFARLTLTGPTLREDLVAEDGAVAAWSALAPFSHRPWYAGVAEYTVYVAAARQGRGIGGRMLDALLGEAPRYGYWKLVGMILPENAAGLALARRAGFRVVGTHLAHGRRDGRWRDVTIVERHLEAGPGTATGGLTES